MTLNSNSLIEDLIVLFLFTSDGGNNVFIDNIQVAHPDQISVEKPLQSTINVFPNPSDQTLHIDMGNQQIKHAELINVDGKTVYVLDNNATTFIQIPTALVTSGTYIIRLISDLGVHQIKHIILH